MRKEIIEKAEKKPFKSKYQIGDQKMVHGKLCQCVGYSDRGDPKWKVMKNGGGQPQADSPKSTSAPQQTQAQPSQTETKNDSAQQKQETVSSKYDAPEPKVEYKTKRPPEGAEYQVPEKWKSKSVTGGVDKEYKRESYRKVYSDTTKMPDDNLLKILNNPKGNINFRQLAYEEAMARGIPEDKIDVSGTLEDKWDKIKMNKHLFSSKPTKEVSEEEMEVYDDSALGDFDPDKFIDENFDGGRDDGWKNPDNPIIQRKFNNLSTLSSRRRYDAMVDYLKRKDPRYKNPEKMMQKLAVSFNDFITNPKGSPLMVSAGGAGAGKTWRLNKVLDFLEMKRFDSNKHQPGDGDYDYVIVSNDMEDDKDFLSTLSKHNGKLIVFDDKDKLLVSNQNKIVSTMKAIADGDPNMRVFYNPKTGKDDKFTGKLIFLTNKTLDTLNNNEDHKAIMSRSRVEDVHFTVNENLDLLKERYKTMGDKMDAVDAGEEQDIRKQLFKLIINNSDKLDPSRFTVRKFSKMLEAVNAAIKANKQRKENDAASDLFGSEEDDWLDVAMDELMKSENNGALSENDEEEEYVITDEISEKMKKMYKKDPDLCIELFGKEFCEAALKKKSDGKKGDNDVVKSFMDDISGMSLTEAENLLFG